MLWNQSNFFHFCHIFSHFSPCFFCLLLFHSFYSLILSSSSFHLFSLFHSTLRPLFPSVPLHFFHLPTSLSSNFSSLPFSLSPFPHLSPSIFPPSPSLSLLSLTSNVFSTQFLLPSPLPCPISSFSILTSLSFTLSSPFTLLLDSLTSFPPNSARPPVITTKLLPIDSTLRQWSPLGSRATATRQFLRQWQSYGCRAVAVCCWGKRLPLEVLIPGTGTPRESF